MLSARRLPVVCHGNKWGRQRHTAPTHRAHFQVRLAPFCEFSVVAGAAMARLIGRAGQLSARYAHNNFKPQTCRIMWILKHFKAMRFTTFLGGLAVSTSLHSTLAHCIHRSCHACGGSHVQPDTGSGPQLAGQHACSLTTSTRLLGA